MQQVGKPVTGIEFIGRGKEISQLMGYLKMGQSVVIIAPRRFGKTSLVMEALKRLEELGNYTAFVDVFANPGLDLLASAITTEVLKNHKLHKQFLEAKNSASALIRNIKLKSVIDDFQFIIGFSENNKNEWELLSESIDFIDGFSKKHKKQLICAFDEFGDIQKFDNEGGLIKLFRSKIQLQTNTTYIFSGSYESVMQNIFVSSKSPFYRMVRIIRLDYLDHLVLENNLSERLSHLNIKMPAGYLKYVISQLKGHPYYCQLAFQQIALLNLLENKLPDEDRLLDEMLCLEKDYLEKVWEGISGNREFVYVLRELVKDSKNVYTRLKYKKLNISRAINKLEGMGLLFKNDQVGYYLSDPLLEKWILKNTM